MSNLTGRAALVTGGSRGIGAAVAERLATDGADVAITYLSAADKAGAVVERIETAGRRALAIEADSADAEAVAAAVERTADTLGRLDILVNNAGIFPAGPLEAFTLEEIDQTLAVHIRAAFVGAARTGKRRPATMPRIGLDINLRRRWNAHRACPHRPRSLRAVPALPGHPRRRPALRVRAGRLRRRWPDRPGRLRRPGRPGLRQPRARVARRRRVPGRGGQGDDIRTDMATTFPAVVECRRRHFTPPYPADSIVEVAGLYTPEAQIEIGAIAVVADQRARQPQPGTR